VNPSRPAGSWSAQLWQQIEPIHEQILRHPFLTGLGDGTLPPEAFTRYIAQDVHYLRDYARALAVVGAKAPTHADTAMFARHAAGAVDAELSLHSVLLPALGLAPALVAAVPVSPTTRAYTSYLLATAYGGSFAEGLAAVLPCYWIYAQVGAGLVKQGSPDQRYQQWIDAVKIGMLGTAEVIRAVADVLGRHRPAYVVLDPVMVATSGDRLLAADAVRSLREELLPRCDLITPNLPEAADLLGESQAADEEVMHEQLARLAGLAPGVLLKGGHLSGGDSVDLLSIDGHETRLVSTRIATTSTHGTGCTLSSAIAALRPQHPDWEGAVREAKDYTTRAIAAADQLDVGSGHGPVHHFHSTWPGPADLERAAAGVVTR
jgi:hydroxymethylpyrimidine/phosphomethylpyrimidine kinase